MNEPNNPIGATKKTRISGVSKTRHTPEQFKQWDREAEAKNKQIALRGLRNWLDSLPPAITKKEKHSRVRLRQFIKQLLNE